MPAEDGYLYKAEVAQHLGVGVRTVERYEAAGKLGARTRPGFPTEYNPADVAKLAAERRTGVRAVILPAVVAANGHGPSTDLARRAAPSPLEALVVQLLETVLARLGEAPTGPTAGPTHGPTGPTGPTLWLTLRQAAALSGRSQACLRRKIQDGTLYAERDRGWRIRRRDLEQV